MIRIDIDIQNTKCHWKTTTFWCCFEAAYVEVQISTIEVWCIKPHPVPSDIARKRYICWALVSLNTADPARSVVLSIDF